MEKGRLGDGGMEGWRDERRVVSWQLAVDSWQSVGEREKGRLGDGGMEGADSGEFVSWQLSLNA